MANDPQSAQIMKIELTCRRIPGGAVITIEGQIEGDPHDLSLLREASESSQFNLSEVDSRLEGKAILTGEYASLATRSALKVSGPATVEGRALEAGDRVRITVGGDITWNR
jgi:hypothetical protein